MGFANLKDFLWHPQDWVPSKGRGLSAQAPCPKSSEHLQALAAAVWRVRPKTWAGILALSQQWALISHPMQALTQGRCVLFSGHSLASCVAPGCG